MKSQLQFKFQKHCVMNCIFQPVSSAQLNLMHTITFTSAHLVYCTCVGSVLPYTGCNQSSISMNRKINIMTSPLIFFNLMGHFLLSFIL